MAWANTPMGASDRILVLAGVTAGRRERRFVGERLRILTGIPVAVPWLPYSFGLSACVAWLSWRWPSLMGSAGRVHLLAYIGGAAILSIAAPRLELSRLGRVVIDRGPIQELVPAEFTRRTPSLLRAAPGFGIMADLARVLPNMELPPLGMGDLGLIVEHGVSRMAQKFGLIAEVVPEVGWSTERLAKGALETLHLDLSHDAVYEDDRFVRPAAQFLTSGHFALPQAPTTSRRAARHG